MYKVVLASNSPRRKEILARVGIEFVVIPSNVEEIITKTKPDEIVKELSYIKAMDVSRRVNDQVIIIGADTIVSKDGEILGKPKDEADAKRMLKLIEGSSHQVYTGVTVIIRTRVGEIFEDRVVQFAERTEVMVQSLTEKEIDDYIMQKEAMDKAGAYGIQGLFAIHITGISGDYYNVVGFPVSRFYEEMKKCGIDIL